MSVRALLRAGPLFVRVRRLCIDRATTRRWRGVSSHNREVGRPDAASVWLHSLTSKSDQTVLIGADLLQRCRNQLVRVYLAMQNAC